MSTDNLADYRQALDRLIRGRPQIVPKGTRISRDAVSLEAGRGKGTIKKSRAVFTDLIAEINAAATEQAKPKISADHRIHRLKAEAKDLREQLDAALAREMSLVYELFEAKHRLAEIIKSTKVVPIRSSGTSAKKE